MLLFRFLLSSQADISQLLNLMLNNGVVGGGLPALTILKLRLGVIG
jgi:hypothetical protein